MVKLNKTPLPNGIIIKSEQDYRSDKIFDILIRDCNSKCYICEDKPTTINIEHIIPHRNDPALKLCWDNLFIACGHCNNTKSDKYENIIDPVKLDPEEYVSLSIIISGDLIDSVDIKALKNDESTLQTASLLRLVYNDGSTAIKKVECSNLKNQQLMPTIRLFYQYIENYRKEPDMGYDCMIREEIDRSSKFAAFKRKIIKDDPKLREVFADALV